MDLTQYLAMKTRKTRMVTSNEALPGRAQPILSAGTRHFVSGEIITPPYATNLSLAMFGMGCFWGAEKRFWSERGVIVTAVGYAAGYTANPTYEEVCSGLTGHNEVVRVIYDASIVSYETLLKIFWQSHDPTQGMRQGNDVGTQYRSGIYTYNDEQHAAAIMSRDHYQDALTRQGMGKITSEILVAAEFFFAEDYHQQYLAKNPNGYCGLGGTGVCF